MRLTVLVRMLKSVLLTFETAEDERLQKIASLDARSLRSPACLMPKL